MRTAPRFRFSEAAAIRKHVLRVPTQIIEHLVTRSADAPAGTFWLHRHDVIALDSTLHADALRLVGMYVALDDDGTVTEIGLRRDARPLRH
ncbi:hypothetical protein GCM10007860_30560 [Chitiniphilus shinanonensis]|uniref:Uncharacterized protein n=1 Tax=Chitiniphilus shinanonensis TaxID=553088 RepID=A0ABQ6BW38_9NEIS|nr:hypothetical protein [Chitiniphilus shinanonensis]GLS05894.1 hypothetical protein GCM10007860_30560 [Chitiniphilus shinanonensis]